MIHSRIERYTSLAQQPSSSTLKPDGTNQAPTAPLSPSASNKANAPSSTTTTAPGGGDIPHIPSYHQFPAQAARIPSHAHLQDAATTIPPRTAPTSAPQDLPAPTRSDSYPPPNEPSWPPVDGFNPDRHISASEPRIFPGVVSSRHHRRESSARPDTPSDDPGLVMRKKTAGGVPPSSPGKTRVKDPGMGVGVGVGGAVEESSDEDE
jgi:AMP deaminase